MRDKVRGREEKRKDLKESFMQKKRDENTLQKMLAYKEAIWGLLYLKELYLDT